MRAIAVTKSPEYARYNKIYSEGAERYDRLVAREDVDHNILPGLKSVAAIESATIIELGCGTGRLTRLIAPEATSVHAFDIEPAMIEVACKHFVGISHVSLNVSDHQNIPADNQVADTTLAGWTLNHHLRQSENWELEIDKTINEMSRVTKPDGTLVILETLGVGKTEPSPPNSRLEKYYSLLEKTHGFSRKVIQTDYLFASHEEALELVEFFFGDELRQVVEQQQLIRLPEFTGIWSRSGG